VIHDDDRCALPSWLQLQEVDYPNEEILLIQWVRITGVPVLVSLRLQEAHGGGNAGADRGKEIPEGKFMVGRAIVVPFNEGCRPRVVRIGGRCVVLKPCVVWNIILSRRCESGRTPFATGSAVCVLNRKIEPTHERSPSHTRGVEQVTDILSSHGDLVSSR